MLTALLFDAEDTKERQESSRSPTPSTSQSDSKNLKTGVSGSINKPLTAEEGQEKKHAVVTVLLVLQNNDETQEKSMGKNT